MPSPQELAQKYSLSGLTFDEQAGLTRLQVAIPSATAIIFLQGAHLTAWQPLHENPAIFLSSKTPLGPGKAIRGGIPIVFPWFASDSKKDRINGHPGPMHGFARIQDWSLDSARMEGPDLVLGFSQGPTDLSRSMGFEHFALKLDFRIGAQLTLTMTVQNTGPAPLTYEQAFHTYYRVADIHETTVSGLEGVSFIDKTDKFQVKHGVHEPIHFMKTEDRIYNHTTGPCTIADVAGRRRILAAKQGSNSTVVWNAFAETSEIGPWDWHEYVAVETANVGSDAVTLQPQSSATMQLKVTIEKP